MLLDTYYRACGDVDQALSAASRLLQVDPNNLKAIFYSVIIKKSQCAKTQDDAQTCDDAAALARKGLAGSQAGRHLGRRLEEADRLAYPIFHSAIALDDAVSKKDFKAAIDEYTQELMLYYRSADADHRD